MIKSENSAGCVLVVEDHEDTLRLVLRLLTLSGYTAHGAGSFAEAVRVASRHNCHLLIADLGLPDGSGLDLLPALRRHYGSMRGIAVTGDAAPEILRATLDAGYDAHLVKPMTFEKLLTALQAAEGVRPEPTATEAPIK